MSLRITHNIEAMNATRNLQANTAKISQSMERKLTLRESIDVKLHLWICAWCQWYLEHLHLIHDVARAQDPDLTPGPTLSPEARERIKRATDLHR